MAKENRASEWPEEELERVVSCPVCASHRRKLLHGDLTDRVYFCAPGKWQLFRCQDCECAYLDPRPDKASIGRAYAKFYTHSPAFQPTNSPDLNPLKRLRAGLRNGYINHRHQAFLLPEARLGAWLIPLLPTTKNRIDYALRHLPRRAQNSKNSLLDIGCGNGAFLRSVTELGWEGWGVDSDPRAVEVSRECNLRVSQGHIEDISLPAAYFEAITLSHVIEHVHEPVGVLKKAFALLRPGGMIWIATPNLKSCGHKHFGRNWVGLDSPRHLTLFTHRSLTQTLTSVGFEGISIQSFHPPSRDWYQMSHKVASGKLPFEHEPCPIPMPLQLQTIWASIRAMIDPQKREEIVLVATKPR